jgi:hypothetical protein
MNNQARQSRKVRGATPNLLVENLKAVLGAMKAATQDVKAVVPVPLDVSVTRPAPPVMFTPKAALPLLRAGTGCPIARETLYLWIKMEKVYAVRMGRRIYIPAEALDDLIARCLAGVWW